MIRVVPDSFCRKSWVLRATRAEKSVGSASASSSALVWSDWVCPCVAAIASIVVRTTLLKTSCAASDQPEVWQWTRSISDFSSFGAKRSFISFAQRRRAARSFATSMKKFMPMPKKNETRGAKASTSRPASRAGADIFEPVGERVGEFEVGGRSGLLHVIAGHRDRIELRHLRRRVGDDVGDDPHRRAGRVDEGVPDHELLEHVVLDRARELLRPDAVLLGGEDVERHHRQHRAVHRHRHADPVERDAVEQRAHVENRIDRDAGHADVAGDARIVRVVAAVGRQVEGDRQAALARRQGSAGRRRSNPPPSRSRHTGGSSRAARHTSSGRGRGRRAAARASRRRSRCRRCLRR